MKLTGFLNDKRLFAPEGEEGAAAPDAPSEPAASAEPDLSWLPEDFRSDDGPKWDDFRVHYQEATAELGRLQERTSQVPDAYEFSLPEDMDYGDIDLPEGFKIDLAVDDPDLAPVFEEFGEALKRYELPAGAAQEMLGLMAKYQARQFAKAHATVKAEQAKLGPTAEARIASVQRALDTRLPGEQAKALADVARSADAVKALETLLKPRTTGQPSPSAPKTADLEGLPAYERLKRINQMQMKG